MAKNRGSSSMEIGYNLLFNRESGLQCRSAKIWGDRLSRCKMYQVPEIDSWQEMRPVSTGQGKTQRGGCAAYSVGAIRDTMATTIGAVALPLVTRPRRALSRFADTQAIPIPDTGVGLQSMPTVSTQQLAQAGLREYCIENRLAAQVDVGSH